MRHIIYKIVLPIYLWSVGFKTLEGYITEIENDYKNLNPTIEKRWEQGIPHHPKSYELYKHIENIDYKQNNDRFQWKCGGDGDNGEDLMYIMDSYFEAQG